MLLERSGTRYTRHGIARELWRHVRAHELTGVRAPACMRACVHPYCSGCSGRAVWNGAVDAACSMQSHVAWRVVGHTCSKSRRHVQYVGIHVYQMERRIKTRMCAHTHQHTRRYTHTHTPRPTQPHARTQTYAASLSSCQTYVLCGKVLYTRLHGGHMQVHAPAGILEGRAAVSSRL